MKIRRNDSETYGMISICLLGSSMFFGILSLFNQSFTFICIMSFIAGTLIGILGLYLSTKQ